MAEELELMQTSCISSSPLLLFHWPLSADTLVVFPGNSYCCVVKCIHRRKLDLPFSLVLGLYLLQAPPPLLSLFPSTLLRCVVSVKVLWGLTLSISSLVSTA